MEKNRRNHLVVLFLFTLILSSCVIDLDEGNKNQKNTNPVTSIAVNELNELGKQEFILEYSKLPSDYIIELGSLDFFRLLGGDTDEVINSKWISKDTFLKKAL